MYPDYYSDEFRTLINQTDQIESNQQQLYNELADIHDDILVRANIINTSINNGFNLLTAVVLISAVIKVVFTK